MRLTVNNRPVVVEDAPDTPLLWVIRDSVGLTGTKFGCGVAQCGACTVLVDGAAVRSCSVPVGTVAGKHVTTIEGLARGPAGETLTRVQEAWIDHQVPQCGYCQSGFIMATTALLAKTPHPTDAQIDESLTNICRCGTYDRIRAAIHQAAGQA
jgi:isoquinoline 1-oxidoreductase alpha subunit